MELKRLYCVLKTILYVNLTKGMTGIFLVFLDLSAAFDTIDHGFLLYVSHLLVSEVVLLHGSVTIYLIGRRLSTLMAVESHKDLSLVRNFSQYILHQFQTLPASMVFTFICELMIHIYIYHLICILLLTKLMLVLVLNYRYVSRI